MNANILLEAESHSLPVSAMRKQAVVFITLLLKPQNGILIYIRIGVGRTP